MTEALFSSTSKTLTEQVTKHFRENEAIYTKVEKENGVYRAVFVTVPPLADKWRDHARTFAAGWFAAKHHIMETVQKSDL